MVECDDHSLAGSDIQDPGKRNDLPEAGIGILRPASEASLTEPLAGVLQIAFLNRFQRRCNCRDPHKLKARRRPIRPDSAPLQPIATLPA